MALIPCPACQRHVYTTETICPFCHHELGTLDVSGSRRAPVGRMSRAALVVLGMSSVACGGDTEQSGDDTASDTGSTTGGPNTTATAGPSTTATPGPTNSTNTTTDTASSSWAVQSAYGGPSIGFTTTGTPSTSASVGTDGSGGTDGQGLGGAGGEAGDVGGAGGNTPGPTTGGQPIYGAPPTPW